MADYRVDLPVFRGPLDLLLHLVKKHEVEIADIPIAAIAEQYLAYLNMLQRIDVEAAGEFLVMASTLMEIKSRLLLPRPPAAPDAAEEEDPRSELVRQLIEYKKHRDAAERLEALADAAARRRARQLLERPDLPADPAAQPLQQVELWDLVSAFDRVLRSTTAAEANTIVDDDTPQEEHMAAIVARLEATPRLAGAPPRLEFAQLFEPPVSRSRWVGWFLALLELIKAKRVEAEQLVPFGPIWIVLRSAIAPASNVVAEACALPIGEPAAPATDAPPTDAPPTDTPATDTPAAAP